MSKTFFTTLFLFSAWILSTTETYSQSVLPELLWTKTIKTDTLSQVKDVYQDNDFNVYAAYSVTGISFFTKTSAGGNPVYSYRLGGNKVDLLTVDVDSKNDVWLVGNFSDSLSYRGQHFTGISGWNSFRLICDAGGNLKDMMIIKSALLRAADIASDGKVYLGGSFKGNVQLGSESFTTNGNYDGLVICCNESGNVLWAKQIKPAAYGQVDQTALCAGTEGCFISGAVTAGLMDDAGQTVGFSGFYSQGTFCAKITQEKKYEWIKMNSYAGSIWVNRMMLFSGDVYLTGSLMGSMAWDKETIETNMIWNSFVVKINGSGTNSWMKTGKGPAEIAGQGIADYGNNILASGRFAREFNWDKISDKVLPEVKRNTTPDGYFLFLDKDGNTLNYYCLKGKGTETISCISVHKASLVIGGYTGGPASINQNIINLGNNSRRGFIAKFVTTGIIPLDIECTKKNVSKHGGNDGRATVNILQGNPPYSILWSNKETSLTIDHLTAAIYDVKVIDSKENIATCSAKVGQPDSVIEDNVTKTNDPKMITVICRSTNCSAKGSCDGTVTAEASGSNPPYEYVWSCYRTGAHLTDLCAGKYTVTATDAKGLTDVCTTYVRYPNPVPLKIKCTIFVSNASGHPSTIIGTEIISGTSLYEYKWSDKSTYSAINGATPGNYTVTVTDAMANTATCGISVPGTIDPEKVKADCDKKNVTVTNDGEAWVVASHGVPPYTYKWTTGATTDKITGLKPGPYKVWVTDSKNSVDTCSVLITAPTGGGLTVNCSGKTPSLGLVPDGSATAEASGGTPPYNYKWSNNKTTPTITNLSPGRYKVTVTDANSLTATCSVLLQCTIPPTDCKPRTYLVANLMAGTDYLHLIRQAVIEAIKRYNSKMFDILVNQYDSLGWQCKHMGVVLGIFEKTLQPDNQNVVLSMMLSDKEIIEKINAFGTATHLKMVEYSVPLTFEYDPNNTYQYKAFEFPNDEPADYEASGQDMKIINQEGKAGWEFVGINGDLAVFIKKNGETCNWEYTGFYTNSFEQADRQIDSLGHLGYYIFTQPVIFGDKEFPNMAKRDINHLKPVKYYATLYPVTELNIFSGSSKTIKDLDETSADLNNLFNNWGKKGYEFKMGFRVNKKVMSKEFVYLLFYVPESCMKK